MFRMTKLKKMLFTKKPFYLVAGLTTSAIIYNCLGNSKGKDRKELKVINNNSLKKDESSTYITNTPSQNMIMFPWCQLAVAAGLWAQYLPGVKKTNFDEINQNSKIDGDLENTLRTMYEMHESTTPIITAEKYNKFIEILCTEISLLKPQKYFGLSYLQIGDSSSYGPPKIIEDAMEKAGIHASAFGIFPYKQEMRIYNNGQIQMGKKVICTDPMIKYYDYDTDFDNASLMKITGDKFRLIEINLDNVKGHLLTGSINNTLPLREFEKKDVLLYGDDVNEKISQIYTKIYRRDFKGSEQEFLQISNAELIEILQDKNKLNANFNDHMYLYYHKSKAQSLGDDFYFDIGNVVPEKIENNYYQYSTGPVKVLSAQYDGTVGRYILIPVSPMDFIFKPKKDDKEPSLKCLRKSNSGFEARLCDESGRLLSDKIYKPGNEIPFNEIQNVSHINRGFRMSQSNE